MSNTRTFTNEYVPKKGGFFGFMKSNEDNVYKMSKLLSDSKIGQDINAKSSKSKVIYNSSMQGNLLEYVNIKGNDIEMKKTFKPILTMVLKLHRLGYVYNGIELNSILYKAIYKTNKTNKTNKTTNNETNNRDVQDTFRLRTYDDELKRPKLDYIYMKNVKPNYQGILTDLIYTTNMDDIIPNNEYDNDILDIFQIYKDVYLHNMTKSNYVNNNMNEEVINVITYAKIIEEFIRIMHEILSSKNAIINHKQLKFKYLKLA